MNKLLRMRRLREVGTESGQPQVRVDEIGKEGVLIVRVAFNPLHALRVVSICATKGLSRPHHDNLEFA